VRELMNASDLALHTIQDELRKLRAVGLLTSWSNGYHRFYRANRDHAMHSLLVRIVQVSETLPCTTHSALRRPRSAHTRQKRNSTQIAVDAGRSATELEFVLASGPDSTALSRLVSRRKPCLRLPQVRTRGETTDSDLRASPETPISFTLMVHHIVLYKLKPEVTPARVEAMMMNTRMQLLKIPEVLSIKCGKRIDPELPWPFFIAIDFESMDKYAIFREDPIFVKFIEEVIKPNTEDSLDLDFEMDPGKDVRFS
jgi:hypothetical protein